MTNTPDDKSNLCEIDFTVSAKEAALIDRWASTWGVPRDEAATRLAKEGLQSLDSRKLKNPLVSTFALSHPKGAAETIENVADQLMLLADLFGGDDDRYITLNTDASHRAMHLQLQSMGLLLEAVGQALTVETTKASP